MLTRLFGFARLAIIAHYFGASGTADVVHLIFNIPNNLRKLMAEGALSAAFIPVFSASIGKDDRANATTSGIARRIIALQLIVFTPILIAAALFPRQIVETILDFPSIEQQNMAANLFRLVVHYSLLISVAAVLMGAINSHRRFTIPAITPLFFSISVGSSIFLLHDTLGIYSVAVGVITRRSASNRRAAANILLARLPIDTASSRFANRNTAR